MRIQNTFAKIIPDLLKVEGIIRKIERKYRDHIVHKGTWIGKTAMLDIMIAPAFNQISNGCAYSRFENNEIRYKILLFVNFKDSTRTIAYVIAHEFAHLLFSIFHNYFNSPYKDTENSGTSFQFRIPDEWEHYGQGMEEAAADIAAMHILSHCRFPDEDGSCAALLKEEYDLFASLAHRFADIFGESLDTLSHFDAFSYEEERIYEDNPQYAEMGDYLDPTQLFSLGPKFHTYIHAGIRNSFWYAAATYSYKTIVQAYESHMGEGSYRELCRDLDYIHSHYHEQHTPPQYVLESRSHAAECLKRAGMEEKISEPKTPVDPETVREAYRRALDAICRFGELYNAPDPEEESADPEAQAADQD